MAGVVSNVSSVGWASRYKAPLTFLGLAATVGFSVYPVFVFEKNYKILPCIEAFDALLIQGILLGTKYIQLPKSSLKASAILLAQSLFGAVFGLGAAGASKAYGSLIIATGLSIETGFSLALFAPPEYDPEAIEVDTSRLLEESAEPPAS